MQTIYNPAGGSPASVSALPGLGALSDLSDVGGTDLTDGMTLDMPGQVATFDSAELTEPLQVTGAPTVRIKVSAVSRSPAGGSEDVTLFAKLYDVGPSGQAGPARRIAAPFRITLPAAWKPATINGRSNGRSNGRTAKAAGTAPGVDVDVALPALDYRFERAHRLRVVIATTDMGFATPTAPAAYNVSVVSGLTVPSVPSLHTPAPPFPAWTWMMLPAALLVATTVLLTGRRRPPRRRRSASTVQMYDPARRDVPLEITGLTKSYGAGRLAVDDLSLRVERGQVLGLPDLLVLDEPTNGLDPPQIREMRDVLRRYADAGRTVIVSSHLLAEVEQTCTHVVVMSRGRGVAVGPVDEIVGTERRLEDAFLAIIGEDQDA